MYIPNQFREDDLEKLIAFMRANSFATLVSIQDGVPIASHIPLVVIEKDDGLSLVGHLAKQNSQWKVFSEGTSLAIFTGPHAYISPTLYETPENVPTWNYIAVHAYGTPQPITRRQAPEEMTTMINTMIGNYEASYQTQWQDLSAQYRERMMDGIVGFEMVVTRLEGKYKLSQNRNPTEQAAISSVLLHHPDSNAYAIGEAMQDLQ